MNDRDIHLLLLGRSYSARHAVPVLEPRLAALAATARSPEKAARLAAEGCEAIDLSAVDAEARLADAVARATHVLASAGPDEAGDPFLGRIAGALEASAAAGMLRWIGLLSTVGVYGDADGGTVDETSPVAPLSERTRRRVAAEDAWVALGRRIGVPVAVLRLAGIYGPGRNPLVNLAQGTAKRIVRPGQVFNRIHVEDIGRAIAAAAVARFDGVVNVADDEPGPPQAPIEFAAALMGIEPPPAIAFEDAVLSPMAASFWGESKRVSNARLHALFGDLRHPTHRDGLAAMWRDGTWRGDEEDRVDASPRFRMPPKGFRAPDPPAPDGGGSGDDANGRRDVPSA